MKSALVLYNDVPAGVLTKSGPQYRFEYFKDYRQSPGSRPISITMPLRAEPYESNFLFPVFSNMLSEGANKKIQNRLLKIDEDDYFSLLLATAGQDSIGPITIKEIPDEE